jgi:hypothetical protein
MPAAFPASFTLTKSPLMPVMTPGKPLIVTMPPRRAGTPNLSRIAVRLSGFFSLMNTKVLHVDAGRVGQGAGQMQAR